MSKLNIGLPQGTRDFDPLVVRKREFIINTIKRVFELYGFEPLETPAMENLDTLLGKYGDEGDKLIFKILNNGLDAPGKAQQAKDDFDKVLAGKNSKSITERALKYDLTIPFARYVAMNHGRLNFPFRRYQIQPVWRADRPQKGRYREFYQCDADVVGSNSLLNEVEFANIYHETLTQMGIRNFEIRINSRKLLLALAESCDVPEKLTDITVAIDKIDKIGLDEVKNELRSKALTEQQINIISQYLSITGDNHAKTNKLKEIFGPNPTGDKGIEELEYVCGYTANNVPLTVDLTLARGLNYYTGLIFEVTAPPPIKIGSLGGGGRYDDLTGLFGVPGVPGVGISFGVDRIYDVMEELNLFPDFLEVTTQVLFFNLGDEEAKTSFSAMQKLRAKGVRCEIYPVPAKFDKQFKYAEKKRIPFAVIIGSKEMQENSCVIRNLRTGQQQTISLSQVTEESFAISPEV